MTPPPGGFLITRFLYAAFYCTESVFSILDDNCFLHRGDDYRGTLNITESSTKCKKWNETMYYRHTNKYPELRGGHNYCRNPGQARERPWCLVNENGMDVAQYCNIPRCGKTFNILHLLLLRP